MNRVPGRVNDLLVAGAGTGEVTVGVIDRDPDDGAPRVAVQFGAMLVAFSIDGAYELADELRNAAAYLEAVSAGIVRVDRPDDA